MFASCSKYIYNWLSHQAHVKEESLTDWLLYNVSQQCDFIYYQAFSRHEEARNGSDWEWWILTPDRSGLYKFNAYRFLIQAKKLLPNDKDNYSLINYGNQYGTQIDLLMESAKNARALPIYMYYSIGKPDVSEQIKNINYINEDIISLYKNYNDGCYLSYAVDVYKLLYNTPRKQLLDYQLLNYSFRISLLDLFLEYNIDDINKRLNEINWKIREVDGLNKDSHDKYSFGGIRHSEKSIPDYLAVFISDKHGELSWFDREMKISGLGVIDLRNK